MYDIFIIKQENNSLGNYRTIIFVDMIFNLYCVTYIYFLSTAKMFPLFRVPNDFTCSICLDNSHHNVYELNCSHQYHLSCITEWNEKNQTCPLCRITIDVVL